VRPNAILILALAATASVGCRRHRAAQADCASILDRLVELELTESGYHDQVLRARWRTDLQQRLSGELERCRTFMVRDDLARCLSNATVPEDITHRCLK